MRTLQIDTSALPLTAQQELLDHYQSLLKKYNCLKKDKKIDIKDIVPRKVKDFTPLKREDIYEQ